MMQRKVLEMRTPVWNRGQNRDAVQRVTLRDYIHVPGIPARRLWLQQILDRLDTLLATMGRTLARGR